MNYRILIDDGQRWTVCRPYDLTAHQAQEICDFLQANAPTSMRKHFDDSAKVVSPNFFLSCFLKNYRNGIVINTLTGECR